MVDFVYESGEPIVVGSHGQTDHVFASGTPVTNGGESSLVYESGVGLGGGNVIDDFERGNLDPYDTSNSGGYFAVVESPVYEGGYALQIRQNYADDNSRYYVRSTSGLTAYPSPGDTFSFWYRPEGPDPAAGDKAHFRFNITGTEANYDVWINQSTGSVHYEKVTLGQVDSVTNDGVNIIDPGNGAWDSEGNTWYEIEVDWTVEDNGDYTFTLTVYDVNGNPVQGPHTGTDTNPLPEVESVEWDYHVASTFGDSAEYVYFDYARIK